MTKRDRVVAILDALESATNPPWQVKNWVREEMEEAYHRDGFYMQEIAPGVTVPIQIIKGDWDL